MKILTIYYKHKPGGFCKRLQMKIQAYLKQGWEVHYIAVEPFPYSHPKLIPHIFPAPTRTHDSIMFWLWFFVMAPLWIISVARKSEVHLISVFSPLYAALCVPAKRMLNLPMITFIRMVTNAQSFSYKQSKMVTRLEWLLNRIGLKSSDRLIANSKAVQASIRKSHKVETEILYNHIEDIAFDKTRQREKLIKEFSLEPNSFVITTSGLIEKRKNLDCLLSAFSDIHHETAVLLVVGDGTYLPDLKNSASKMGISPKVIFTGWREDVRDLIQGSDLFVFCSLKEGMPNSLLEAMACQVPCLISSIPENVELIQNEEQHFPPDHPEILTNKINRLIEDSRHYNEILQATLEDKQRFLFDWSGEVVQRTEELLKRPHQRY